MFWILNILHIITNNLKYLLHMKQSCYHELSSYSLGVVRTIYDVPFSNVDDNDDGLNVGCCNGDLEEGSFLNIQYRYPLA
jgi:hypothetical protein